MANKKFTGTTAQDLFFYLVDLGYDPEIVSKLMIADEIVTALLRFMTALTAGLTATQILRYIYGIIFVAIENGISNKYIRTLVLILLSISAIYGYVITSRIITDSVFGCKRDFIVARTLRHLFKRNPIQDPVNESEDAAV